MRFPKRLPFNLCRNMSGVKISGTRSKKYPSPALPFTCTPSPRNCRTHCHTIERDTPISRAIRAPLITIVAFFASSVSKAASRLSVVPGRVSWAIEVLPRTSAPPKLTFPARAAQARQPRAKLCGWAPRRVIRPRCLSVLFQFRRPFAQLLQLDPLVRECRFQATNNLLRRPAAKSFVPQLALFRRNRLLQSLDLLLQPRLLRFPVHRIRIRNPNIERRRRPHRSARLLQRLAGNCENRE